MPAPTPRVKLPKSVAAGEPFVVKTRITHPMDTGFQRDAGGELIPQKIINRFLVRFEGEVVISADLQPAVSADPYFRFEMAVPHEGVVEFEWTDDDGSTYGFSQRVRVA